MTVGNCSKFHSAHTSCMSHQHGCLVGQWDALGVDQNLTSQRGRRFLEDQRLRNMRMSAQPNSLGGHKRNAMPYAGPSPHLPLWNSSPLRLGNAKHRFGDLQDVTTYSTPSRRHPPQRPSALPTLPDISDAVVASTRNAQYAILISMYEVYNDRIFDLLSPQRNTKEARRRPLLFKSTEGSPDRKVVAGLRKVVCGSYDEALMVLETGLIERRVAGTGSNSVSSRSHGFFCVEVKKRATGGMNRNWHGSHLTVVDLAGRSWSCCHRCAAKHFQVLRGHATPARRAPRLLKPARSTRV